MGPYIDKVKRRSRERGLASVLVAIAETLARPVVRRRRRLVFEAPLNVEYAPSTWSGNEILMVIGPEQIDSLNPQLAATLEIDRHREDLETIHKGNRLFVVASGTQVLHRGYVCTVDPPAVARHERKAIFFGDLSDVPTIRSCETTAGARGKGLYRRVLNEQLRYLRSLGYSRAVLYIMAENTASVRGATAAGFRLSRVLVDWILFETIVFQKVAENGSARWRAFLQ